MTGCDDLAVERQCEFIINFLCILWASRILTSTNSTIPKLGLTVFHSPLRLFDAFNGQRTAGRSTAGHLRECRGFVHADALVYEGSNQSWLTTKKKLTPTNRRLNSLPNTTESGIADRAGKDIAGFETDVFKPKEKSVLQR
jgi:hypothetical protein